VWWWVPNSISLSLHVIHVHLPWYNMSLLCLLGGKKKKKKTLNMIKKKQFNNNPKMKNLKFLTCKRRDALTWKNPWIAWMLFWRQPLALFKGSSTLHAWCCTKGQRTYLKCGRN
jgi:hypothetical protein